MSGLPYSSSRKRILQRRFLLAGAALLLAGGAVSTAVLARFSVGHNPAKTLLSLDRSVLPATLLSEAALRPSEFSESEQTLQATQVDFFTQLPGVGPQDRAAEVARTTQPTFDGRPLRAVRRMAMKVTAYSPDERSCGVWADGITASGYSVWTNGMNLVAADTRVLPFGTLVSVPGYNGGRPVQVLDRGGAIKGNRLDVLYPSHEIALQWGVQSLEVTVWEFAD